VKIDTSQFFLLVAAWLNISVVRAVALLSADNWVKLFQKTGYKGPSKATKSKRKRHNAITLQFPENARGG